MEERKRIIAFIIRLRFFTLWEGASYIAKGYARFTPVKEK